MTAHLSRTVRHVRHLLSNYGALGGSTALPKSPAVAEPKRVHVFISGDVQGVGFRWSCREQAIRRNVSGFVRNLHDGRVEAAFEGEPAAVDAVVEWCRHGPAGAQVHDVTTTEEQPQGDQRFLITRA